MIKRAPLLTLRSSMASVMPSAPAVRHHARAYRLHFDLAELEHERCRNVLAFERCLAAIELPRLVVVVRKALGPSSYLRAADAFGVRNEAPRLRLARPWQIDPFHDETC